MKHKTNYPLYEAKEFNDFKGMLDDACDAAGDKAAFMYNEGERTVQVTYNEFSQRVKALGTAMTNLGVRYEHIAMIGENSFDWLTVYYTVLCSDGVFVPIDKDLPFNEIINVLIHSESKVVFFSKAFEEKFRENVGLFPDVKYFIGIGLDENDENGRFYSFEHLIDDGAITLAHGSQRFWKRKTNPDSMRLLVYTSGTTGNPKGVMLSQKGLAADVYGAMQIIKLYNRNLSTLPYHHTYEAVCDILISLCNHSTICINESIRTFGANLLKYKPDYIMLVPLYVENLYKRVMKSVDDSGKSKQFAVMLSASKSAMALGIDARRKTFKPILDLLGGNLKKIICGGAPIRPELAEFFESIGIQLANGYGITECSPLVSVNRDYFCDYHSVGTPLPCCDVRIDDPDEELEGEVLVKGDNVLLGYYKNPEETEKVFTSDGYFRTGDYGKINENGLLYITGRKKNMIVLKSGKNIYPEEIECYVQSFVKGVCEVIVYSVRNARGEEIGLCSEIYPEKSVSSSMSNDEMKVYFKTQIEEMNKNLPIQKNIMKIKLRETEFPKTTSNKIKRVGIGSNS